MDGGAGCLQSLTRASWFSASAVYAAVEVCVRSSMAALLFFSPLPFPRPFLGKSISLTHVFLFSEMSGVGER